jgi:Ca-activated chloride channel family protein
VTLAPTTQPANNRDFILKYRLMGQQIQSGLMLYRGQDENFFLLLAQPPENVRPENIPPREYIFVVDVSGSMNGFPLNITKNLMRKLVSSLKPTDTFNVILFAGVSNILSERSLPATPENILRAIRVIDEQRGSGSTRFYPALERALNLPHPENISRSIVVVTDGFIETEKKNFTLIQQNLNNANVFSFGIGSSVNRYLIEGIAKAGQGEPFIITKEAEAQAIADRFFSYIRAPVLTKISVEYQGFEAYAVEPPAIPDLLAQRPLQIFGKWRGQASGTIVVKGTHGEGEYRQTFDLDAAPARPEHRALRYLWARSRVAALSDFNFGTLTNETIKEIVTLGLTYELLTDHTSFVAVHDVVRNPTASSTDVTQPLPLPQGVSNLAVGGGPNPYGGNMSVSSPAAKKVPEPEIMMLLLGLALSLLGAAILRRRSGSRAAT